jgi:hypothetical protein
MPEGCKGGVGALRRVDSKGGEGALIPPVGLLEGRPEFDSRLGTTGRSFPLSHKR